MKHSIYSASAAHRWTACPGSIPLTQDCRDSGSSFAAQEGTALHACAEMCLENNRDAADYIGKTIESIEITDDRAEHVQVYVEYVRGISGQRLVEVESNYAPLLGLEDGEAFGTSDAVILHGRTLHIIDAKFGRRYVNPVGNTQLILYAAGVCCTLSEYDEPPQDIHLHIVQPRVSGKGGSWRLHYAELMAEVQRIKHTVTRAEEARLLYQPGQPESITQFLVAGEQQCQWCPAKLACPAFQQVSRQMAAEAQGQVEKVPSVVARLDPEVLAEWLDMIPLLEAAISAANHEALRRLSLNLVVPGWKLVKGRLGNRKWQDEDTVEQTLKAFGFDKIYNTKLKSPAQMEKSLKGESVKLEPYITRAPAKPTLAREDDPRDAWVEDDDFEVVETN